MLDPFSGEVGPQLAVGEHAIYVIAPQGKQVEIALHELEQLWL